MGTGTLSRLEGRRSRQHRPARAARLRRRRRSKMARTAFIAFAGFFVGSVVTASIAYTAREDLPNLVEPAPPLPALKPSTVLALPLRPEELSDDGHMVAEHVVTPETSIRVPAPDVQVPMEKPQRQIAAAGFVPTGPLFRPRLPARVSTPAPVPVDKTLNREPDHDHATDAHVPAANEPLARLRERLAAIAPTVPADEIEPETPVAGVDTPETQAGAVPAWKRYAAITPPTMGRPLIAVVLDDIGLSQFRADRVIALPAPITVSILPYGNNAARVAVQAREAGHEIMVHLPMEPMNLASNNPGPNALLTSQDRAEIERRIDINLSRFDGYVGVNNHMGSRFTASEKSLTYVMAKLKDRGLLFLDSVTSERSVAFRVAGQLGVPATRRDIFIDSKNDSRFIRRQLQRAEDIARKRGAVVAIGHPYPATLSALREWLPSLSQRGFVLVPISAITAMRLAG